MSSNGHLCILLLLNSPSKQPDQLVLDADLNGSVMQEFPVAGPAALGGAVITGFFERRIGNDVWVPSKFTWIFWGNELMVPGPEMKLSHPMDLHKPVVKLVVLVYVSKKMFEEVQPGTLPDQDQVCGAISEVGGGRQAFWTPGTRAAHAGRVDGDELAVDHIPVSVAIFSRLFLLLRHLIVLVS